MLPFGCQKLSSPYYDHDLVTWKLQNNCESKQHRILERTPLHFAITGSLLMVCGILQNCLFFNSIHILSVSFCWLLFGSQNREVFCNAIQVYQCHGRKNLISWRDKHSSCLENRPTVKGAFQYKIASWHSIKGVLQWPKSLFGNYRKIGWEKQICHSFCPKKFNK